MKSLAWIWEWGQAKEIHKNWRDGLRAAMEIIEKEHHVDWLLDEAPKKEYDWILTWCDSNSNFSRYFTNYSAKRGIFLTTHPSNYHNLKGFDIVFCETSLIYEECRRQGIKAKRAFGTDDQFYTPHPKERDIKYLCIGTYSPWKRQRDIAHLGKDLWCCGTIQPDGQEDYQAVLNAGATVEVGYFPPEHVRSLYDRAQNVIIPAVHGSERTVLESMSMDILPLVTNPANQRAASYIQEFSKSGLLSPREFVLKNYSAKKYAEDIMAGMERCE